MRQTGRTQRQLTEAWRSAQEGKYCFYVAADGRHAVSLYDRLLRDFEYTQPTNYQTLKVWVGENGGCIQVVHKNEDQVHLNRGWFVGAHPECLFFADHYALELHLLEIWAYNELNRINNEGR